MLPLMATEVTHDVFLHREGIRAALVRARGAGEGWVAAGLGWDAGTAGGARGAVRRRCLGTAMPVVITPEGMPTSASR